MHTQYYNYLPDCAKQIRQAVFVDEQGFKSEYDDIDALATHLVLFDGNTAKATCRVFESGEKNVYILGRLAVLKPYRSLGIGSKVLDAAEEYVKNVGGSAIKLHSQCTAKEFYKRAGYTAYGDIEDEQGCPHIWMQKYLV